MSGLFTDEVNAFHIAFVPNECVPDDLRAQINRDTNFIVEQAITNVGQQEVAVIAKQTRHSSLELGMIPREFNLISDRLLETAIEDPSICSLGNHSTCNSSTSRPAGTSSQPIVHTSTHR